MSLPPALPCPNTQFPQGWVLPLSHEMYWLERDGCACVLFVHLFGVSLYVVRVSIQQHLARVIS